MEHIIDILESVFNPKGFQEFFTDLSQTNQNLTGFQDDNTDPCYMCYCCHDGCC
ncbi:MAG: hypothetical protein ABIR06_04150 [Cyclobacteriaceae bacterium]